MSLLIKICGLTGADEALRCTEAGAGAIGLNFYPSSPRYVTEPEAMRIAAALAGSGVLRVGVFVNAPPEQIRSAFARGLIDVAQLHGDETPEDAHAIPGPADIWKALRLAGEEDLAQLAAYAAAGCSRLVIDAPCASYGGSGRRIDTRLAVLAARLAPVLLAGGLGPDNVYEAVRTVRPAGVDVASGVEAGPRRKDLARVSALIAAVRAAELEMP